LEVQTGNIIALVLLTLVIIAVVITIIVNMGTQMKNQATIKIRDVFRDFLSSVTSIHNVCEAYNGKDVSLQDFQMILQEVSLGRCKDVHANVSLTFSLTKDDIKKLVRDTAIIDD